MYRAHKRPVLLFAVAVGMLVWPQWHSPAHADDTIDWYDTECHDQLESTYASLKEQALCGKTGIRCEDDTPSTSSDNPPGYYTFTYTADGIAAIYEATGNEYYLEKLIEFSQDIMSKGEDANGDGYLDYFHWDSQGRASKMKWDYEDYYARAASWNIMRTVARAARVGRLGPHYLDHQADIDEITDFVKTHVVEKWELGEVSLTLDQFLATSSYTIGAAGHIGALLVDAYLATCDEHILDLATRFAEKISSAWLVYSNGSYVWCADGGKVVSTDYTGTTNVNDSSHAIRVLRFADIAHRAGIVVDAADIQGLVKTFNLNLWRGTTQKFADYVNGAQHPSSPGLYSTITQWVRLGGFDPTAHERAATWTGGGRYPRIHYYGILALNLWMQTNDYTLEAACTSGPDSPESDPPEPDPDTDPGVDDNNEPSLGGGCQVGVDPFGSSAGLAWMLLVAICWTTRRRRRDIQDKQHS